MCKLKIELVPSSSWYSNVRSNVTKEQWDLIRKDCYKKANYKCEICGDTSFNQGKKYPLEAHEIWEYNEKNYVQKLIGIIGLCNYCHTVKHPGLAQLNGKLDIVISQLMKVNEITEKEAFKMLDKAFEEWEIRSDYDWKLDIGFLKKYNIN
jgi:hypothetical protein